MASTAEPPEHRACRTQTTPERRGVESALNEWRLGDSNRRNVYIGNDHVGVFFDPAVATGVVAAMNAERPVERPQLDAEPADGHAEGQRVGAPPEGESCGPQTATPSTGSPTQSPPGGLVQIHV